MPAARRGSTGPQETIRASTFSRRCVPAPHSPIMLNPRDLPDSTNFECRNKKPAAVITGAASGIGRELAHLAVREGRLVLLVDRSGKQLNHVVDDLVAQGLSAAA